MGASPTGELTLTHKWGASHDVCVALTRTTFPTPDRLVSAAHMEDDELGGRVRGTDQTPVRSAREPGQCHAR